MSNALWRGSHRLWIHPRFLACSEAGASARHYASVASEIIVVPMPKLSPHMTHGSVAKWLKAPGDQVENYDVIMEVRTESLTEEAYKVGDFEGAVELLVEAQEEGTWGRMLVGKDEQVPVGTPIALMCEGEASPEELENWTAPKQNAYQDGGVPMRTLIWQSYLKSSKRGTDGCM